MVMPRFVMDSMRSLVGTLVFNEANARFRRVTCNWRIYSNALSEDRDRFEPKLRFVPILHRLTLLLLLNPLSPLEYFILSLNAKTFITAILLPRKPPSSFDKVISIGH